MRSATVVAAGVLLVVATATSASAAQVSHGDDWAEAKSRSIRAYDGEYDGNGVYADAYLDNGEHVSQWDGNGSDGNWGPWLNTADDVARFRVCEDNSGCSGWIYNP